MSVNATDMTYPKSAPACNYACEKKFCIEKKMTKCSRIKV